ncbi:MAG: ABC transporter ATP-binding protein/permease [Defluviitaleaceae bacterium]|nr:ABC transporter ATP-binding protein/permease [Defluviitaleaceae bacterium]
MANENDIQFDDLDTKMARQNIKKLTTYMKPYMGWILLVIVTTFISSIIAVWSPHLIGEIVDYIAAPFEALLTTGELARIDMDAIWRLGWILIGIYAGVFVLDFIARFTMTDIAQILSKRLRTDMSAKVDRVPLAHFDSEETGNTLSRITNDVGTLHRTINESFIAVVAGVIMFITTLIIMFTVNWLMAVTAFVAAVVGFAFMGITGVLTQKHFKAQQEELGKLTGHVEEVFGAHDVVKTTGAGQFVMHQMMEINDRLYRSSFKGQFAMSVLSSGMSFMMNISFVFVSVVGAVLAFNGTITFGTIVEFMLYVGLFNQQLGSLGEQAMTMQMGVAASNRIFEFLEADEMENEDHKTTQIETVKGQVLFDDVKFSYHPEKPIIKNFSAAIGAGRKVAIVGPTGAGKTTIVNLLMRFYELNHGAIMIDGVDIATMKREDVYDLFCMVLQDTWIFEGSVYDNIVYNKTGVSYEEVIKVCKAVGIHHYFKSLPDRYDTILTDKVSLSVGQRQLLTIARAMINDAPLLILDEATSSVDTRTELLIQEAMDKLMVGRTSFVIAHRLSTIKNADMILVMNEGDIIEIGTHDELLEADGFYAGLYNSQFEFGMDEASA